MQVTRFTALYLLATIAIFSAITFLIINNDSKSDLQTPIAERGIIDLSNHPLSKGETIKLDGEWELYWGQLLVPKDFKSEKNPPIMSGYFSINQPWKNFSSNGSVTERTGQATFRLHMLSNQEHKRLHLRLFDIHEAYRLWANGELIAQSGIPGYSAQTETPSRTHKIAEISFEEQPVELILQISNHHFRQGGVVEPIMAALPDTFEKIRANDWGWALFLTGGVLIIGIHNLAVYLFRQRNKAPLFFGIYCLLVVGYSITSNSSSWVASTIFPTWSPESMTYFSLICFVCWASLFFRFLDRLYPQEFHRKLVYFLDARILVFFCLIFFPSGLSLSWFIAFCLLQMMLYAGYYIHRVSLAVRRGRSGAQFILLGLTGQFAVGINDALMHMGLIKSVYLAEPGIFLFVLTQSIAMAQRFSASFFSIERLSLELEFKNSSLQKEMNKRNTLEQQVVDISEKERRNISHELHDGLCQQLTGARLRASALAYKNRAKEDGLALTELANLLKESTDDAYKTARGLWPVEHDPSQPGPSLESLVHDIAKSTGIAVTFNNQSHCVTCMNSNMTTLYRVAQEALANAAKHAKANNITVTLGCKGDGKVKLSVLDDGIGRLAAKTTHGGLGMSIMNHRAELMNAHLTIHDGIDGGTHVICETSCSVPESQMVMRKVDD